MAAALSGLTTLLLFAFIYWQTAGYDRRRLDEYLRHEEALLAGETVPQIVRDVERRYAADLHRATFAALFDASGRRLAGDLLAPPADLKPDGRPRWTVAVRLTEHGLVRDPALAVARLLPGGERLITGRSADELAALRTLVLRALLVGLIPGLLLALLGGALLGRRSLARIRALNQAIARIMQGHMEERLPARGRRDALDGLAASVNRMLQEIERLIGEIAGVGDDIAHDLRTPLARVRTRLEGGLRRGGDAAALRGVIEASIADLDQTFQTITALLRIGEISGARRRAHFAEVSLEPILHEAADLYQPIAEQKSVSLAVRAEPGLVAQGDRDLLFEAVANLLDNAIKFAPPGSEVRLRSDLGQTGAVLRIEDAGEGIPEAQREAVLRRFYRGDRSRRGGGHGLGLSIVCAIVRLHGFRLAMGDAGPGLVVEIFCLAEPISSGTDSSGS